MRHTYVGMLVALPPQRWVRFRQLTAPQLAKVLREVAGHVQPARYRKAKRGPKKPAAKKARYQNGGHVSTHKLLEKRKE